LPANRNSHGTLQERCAAIDQGVLIGRADRRLTELERIPTLVEELWGQASPELRARLIAAVGDYEAAVGEMGKGVRPEERSLKQYHRDPDLGGFRTRFRKRQQTLQETKSWLEKAAKNPSLAPTPEAVKPVRGMDAAEVRRFQSQSSEDPVRFMKKFDQVTERVTRDVFSEFGVQMEVERPYFFSKANAEAHVQGVVDIDTRIPIDAVPATLLHEVGHIVFRDRLSKDERPGEFEADLFAGYASVFTGDDVEPFKRWLRQDREEPTHGTHKEREWAMDLGRRLGEADQTLIDQEKVLNALQRVWVPKSKVLTEKYQAALHAYETALTGMGRAVASEEKFEAGFKSFKARETQPDLGGFRSKVDSRREALRGFRKFLGD
jgi:hypothetical protein